MEDSDKTLSGRVNTGRWTTLEHMAFIEGLKRHGREWRKVSGVVPTRTVVQIRTHAQKYFQKLAKEHGTDAAEQAFSSGIQLGVEMGTRVAETEVDTIFERYPDALAAAKQRAFDPPFHSGAMRIPMMGHPVGMGRGFPMAMHGNVPPTPTTANAALMLVKGKTSANLAGGRNTPRTLRTAQWLNDLSSVPGQAAAVMVQPAGGGAGIAGAGRRAAAPAMAQPANPWGCAAAAQAQSQEGERAAEAAASGFPEGAGGVSAVGMHDNQLMGPGEGMSMVPPEGYLMKVYRADGQLVTVLERDPRALAAEHGMVEEHDEAPQGAYPGVYAPVHAPHTEQHPSPDAGGEVGDEGNPSG